MGSNAIALLPICQCCLLFSMMPPDIVGEKMEPEGFYNAVNILLSLQVEIGPFIHFESFQFN